MRSKRFNGRSMQPRSASDERRIRGGDGVEIDRLAAAVLILLVRCGGRTHPIAPRSAVSA